jgi:succinyl-CoA synthetase beta subunit
LKLYEYEAKDILRQHGVPTPNGRLASSRQQAREAASKLRLPVAVKSQVLVSGRGKAGGILFASSVEEAEKTAEELLQTRIKGIPVKTVLVEEKIPIKSELYFGITVDRLNRSYVAVASSTGGVEIEAVAAQSPTKVLRTLIEPLLGFRSFHARKIAKELGYNGEQELVLARIFENLYWIGMHYDSEIIEVNPLVEAVDGKFVAADARIIIDDNALFRHPEYRKKMLEEPREHTPQEAEALKSKIDYVKLDGNIGVVGNGAGLVMATLDMINYYGGKPANFLDLGGGTPTEKTAAALKIVLRDPDVDATFVNILGGITHCDEVAKAIVEARELTRTEKPIIIRVVGTNEEEGKRILRDAGMHVLDNMEEAAEKVVEIARGGTELSGHNC